MIYRIIDGGFIPANIRQDFPNTSFPADLSVATLPDGYIWAEPVPPPILGPYENISKGLPEEYEQGKWRDTWVITPWSQEDIDKAKREEFKRTRAEAVASIVVEVDGLLFDGDETAQTRMARAAVVMQEGETTTWVQANNIPVEVTKAQLIEAVRLAGAEQTRLWVMPSPVVEDEKEEVADGVN